MSTRRNLIFANKPNQIPDNDHICLAFIPANENAKNAIHDIELNLGIIVPDFVLKNIAAAEGPFQFTISREHTAHFIFIPAKIDKSFSPDFFRTSIAKEIKALEKSYLKDIVLILPNYEYYKSYFASKNYLIQSCIEGVYYGNYTFDQFKSDQRSLAELNVHYYSDEISGINETRNFVEIVMGAVNIARDLQNEPSSVLTPIEFSRRVISLFTSSNVSLTIYDKNELEKMKMNGILAVGKGSYNEPQLIQLSYTPSTEYAKHIAFVGKGITFDSGGISIKPAGDMKLMKADMSGAAVVVGIMDAVFKMQLPFKVSGIIPLAENMPSGSAMKPGDIIRTSSGKTIEVDNTDAEGRIILADALHFTSQLKPDIIIDLATLTGACVVALGDFVAGLFTNSEELHQNIYHSGLTTHERVWRLPLWEAYSELNKSDVADIKNTGGRNGSAITAAKFLEQWVDPEIAWAHIDIAGPSCPNKSSSYTTPLHTGFGVRLFIEYLLNQCRS